MNLIRLFSLFKKQYMCFGLLVFGCFGCHTEPTFTTVPDEFLQLDSSVLSISIVADGLDVPWDIQYGKADNSLYFTEIKGRVYKLDLKTGKKKQLITIPGVYQQRTLGLLGMALHPDFEKHPYAYFSYTLKRADSLYSRLVRYTYKKDTLVDAQTLLEIEGSTGHNGARLAFSKDGKLLWATGDVHSKTHAQDSTTLNGKILRMEWDGSIPADNPIKGSYVYAWGFRNMQGLSVSDSGDIYTSEHGDAIEDEVNLIEPLRNYGWPVIEGIHDLRKEYEYAQLKNTREPIMSWTPVIAPAGLAYYGSGQIPEWRHSLLLATLKSQSLRVLKLDQTGKFITKESIYLENHYGRIRAVTVAANGDVYLATSNRDWNPQPGFPKDNDDKILRLSRVAKAEKEPLYIKNGGKSAKVEVTGAVLYNSYCASCHKPDGNGLGTVFPSLANSVIVKGDKGKLMNIFLKGSSKPGKTEQMPSFGFLSDAESAKILSYIRTSWNNEASEITTSEIKNHRK